MGRMILSICAVVVAAGIGALAKAPETQGVAAPRPSPANQSPGRSDEPEGEPNKFVVTILESPEQAAARESAERERRQHDKEDLSAQVLAAEAAKKQILPAWVGAILSGLGTIAILYTLGLARQANRIAQSSVDAVESPYLVVEMVKKNFSKSVAPDGYLTVEFTVKNLGGSPAMIELWHDSLTFSTPGESRWKRVLGGSNYYVVDKGGDAGRHVSWLQANSFDFEKAVAEGKVLVWIVNLSYVDRNKTRYNMFFETTYNDTSDRFIGRLPTTERGPFRKRNHLKTIREEFAFSSRPIRRLFHNLWRKRFPGRSFNGEVEDAITDEAHRIQVEAERARKIEDIERRREEARNQGAE